ncbi:MAG: glycosyltransferase family 2 protein [Pseudomonadota bacterium]
MIAPAEHTLIKPAACPTPRVSVIVPAYRVRATLREAVASLLLQTWRDLEVLVIDDASPEHCTEVLSDIDDARLAVLRLHRNLGLSGARNAGLAAARGEFIALLDGDDISLPHRIERQLARFAGQPRLGLVGCLVNRIDAQGRLVARASDAWRLPDAALKPLLLFTNPFPAVYMLRRSAIPPTGFRPMYAEDYAMAVDVAEHHEVALVHEPLVNYRVSPGGIMRTKLDQVARDALLTQRRLLAALGMPPEQYDPALMAALMHFGRQPPGALAFDRLLALRDWMRALRAANARTRRYPDDALAQACARIWELVLLHATKQERLAFGPRYLMQLWSFSVGQGRGSIRAKALAHGLMNVFRRTPAPSGT